MLGIVIQVVNQCFLMEFELILHQFSGARVFKIVIQVVNGCILMDFQSIFWCPSARNRSTGSKSVHFEVAQLASWRPAQELAKGVH